MGHSIARLQLLSEAATRRDGMRGIQQLQTVTAATAFAHNGKSAKSYWNDTRKALMKQAGLTP